MILDRCRDLVAESCIAQRTIPKGPLSFNFGGYVQLGAGAGSSVRSMEGCVDKVVVQNELLDFYEATSDQPSKQGCLNAAQGCFKQSQSVCGAYGVCKNALRATDMLTCICRPGYRPDTSTGFTPDRWPCNFPSHSWSVTSNPYNAKFLSKVPARIRLSMRTRNLTFRIFVVAAWNLYLTATNGIPKLQLRDQLIELKNINVSDGNWHLYEITITPSIMELQIDELDKDFFETLRVGYFLIPQGPADVVIAKDADTPCIDDVWVDFRDTWKNTEYDYPFENPVKPSYTRYVTWSTQGLTSTCPPGSPQCFSTGQNVSVCDATAVCVDEWRGVRCECPVGYVMDHKGICHLEQCFPNPCLHGECVSFTQTQNFTCQCLPGWTGVHCEISVLPMSSGLDWWWILLVVLLILLIILLALSLVWCCPRKKKPTASTGTKTSLDNEQFGTDNQLNDTWDSGDKAFSGPFNTPVIQAGTKGSQLDGIINFRNGDIPDNTVYLYGNQPFSVPREHGQKTSTVPPWEKFEGKENPNINLDQALEYGYEGFDGRPPPEFCADEPSSLVEDEENADWLLRYSSRRASSHVLPRP
ncbi:unnamed protein product [Dicrocoelium dendriticum]|nr:unnamed protein product [Dicrocoelium dendriticum]